MLAILLAELENCRLEGVAPSLAVVRLGVERLVQFAESRDHTILELAFAWLLGHKPVASVIAGATRAEQVWANASAATWEPTAEELAKLDAILAE